MTRSRLLPDLPSLDRVRRVQRVPSLCSSDYQKRLYPLHTMSFENLITLLLSLQAAYGNSDLFCPYQPPNSFNLVCPKGIRFLNAFPSQVILTSLFEYSIFMVYPSFANRAIQNGRWRGLIRLFIFFTSVHG